MGRAASVACAVALTACAHHPVLYGEPAPEVCQDGGINSEACIGWMWDRVMMATGFRPYLDPALTAYVSSVGARVVAASGERRTWTFRVLDTPEIQASAQLGTIVYLDRGVLARLHDEAELAALLAHEIGHVLGGHGHESFVEFGKHLARSQSDDAATLRAARDDEIQADELAVLLTARAGYDARAVAAMLHAISAPDPEDVDDPDDRHPRILERVARTLALAAHYPGGELDAAAFRAHLAGLVIGDDPRDGAIVGHAAVFAFADVAFDLPTQSATKVSGDAVLFRLEDGLVVEVRTIDPAMVSAISEQVIKPDVVVRTVVTGRGAVMIAAQGAHADAIVRGLCARARSPRPEELAQLHPQRLP